MNRYIGDFVVDLKKSGAELVARIRLTDFSDDSHKDARFYFYLVKDGQVVDRRGWFTENACRWTVRESGVYFVQGYVRIENERELRQSNQITYIARKAPVPVPASDPNLPTGVSIFGSCTTRDLFRLYPSSELELKTYIARQSIVSAVSEPIPLELDQIALDSPFQRTAVWRDFNKTTFDLFKDDGSDWLIIDLIDERFSPVKMGNSYVTKSAAAVEAGAIAASVQGSGRLWNGKDFLIDRVPLRTYVLKFVGKILEIYRPDHIIIHRAMTVAQYYDLNGEICDYSDHERNVGKQINHIIGYMYDLLKEYIPEANEINCISKYYGSERHHWGKATVHYEDGYYAEVMGQVKNVILTAGHKDDQKDKKVSVSL